MTPYYRRSTKGENGVTAVTLGEDMPKDNPDKAYTDELTRRFLASPSDLDDGELLTLLLSFTDCKTHVRDTAAAIKKHFGSYRSCYLASNSELTAIDGVTKNSAMLMLLTASIVNHRDIPSLIGRPVRDYCGLFLAVIRESLDEELWAAVLNDADELINIECISRGYVNCVDVPVPILCRFAAKNNSRKMIIAHSHTGGCGTEASKSDNRALEYIGGILEIYGVTLVGQVIVSGKRAEFYAYTPSNDDI